MGGNIPNDNDYGALRTLTNRFLTDLGVIYSYTSLDPVTGYPTSTFRKKLWATTVGDALCPAGDWAFIYTGAPLTLTSAGNGSLKSSTYDPTTQRGLLIWTTVGTSSAFIPTFSAGTTSMVIYDPTDAATYLSGTTPTFFRTEYLRHVASVDYLRYMDVSGVNGDYYAGLITAGTLTFKSPVEWGDRVTPATYGRNNLDYGQGNWPLEWQIALCAAANKSALYCISTLASDDHVTKFTLLVAAGHPAGRWAGFTLSNELWNTQFVSLYKTFIMGLLEVDAYLPTNTAGSAAPNFYSHGVTYTKVVAGITIDGLGKVILRMRDPHGIAAGNPAGRKVQMKSFVSTALKAQYDTANGAGTAVVFTVEDDSRISFPTTNMTAVAEVSATAVLTAQVGFVSLNADAELMTIGTSTQDGLRYNWAHRRQYQVAHLVRAAWATTGRPMSECKTVLEEQVGGYQNGVYATEKLYAALGYTAPLKTVFTALSVGGYLTLQQNGAAHPGFGLTSNELSPTGTDVASMAASVIAQLRQLCDVAFGVGCYGAVAAWARSVGLELWCYEIGLDTVVGNNIKNTQLQLDGKTAANNAPEMVELLRDWAWAFQAIGFSKMAIFHLGAGSFVTYGCFNQTNTVAEADYTTDPSLQGPKFKGWQAGRVAPALASSRPAGYLGRTNHVVPCVLSGYDYSGNEPVTLGAANVWPSLYQINNVYGYSGPRVGGALTALTYRVWSEDGGPTTMTIKGHNTTSAKTITATVLGTDSSANITAAGGTAAAGVDFTPATLNLERGINYVFVNAPANALNIFPHEVRFE